MMESSWFIVQDLESLRWSNMVFWFFSPPQFAIKSMSKLTVVYHDIHKLYCSLRANQHPRNFEPHPGSFQGRAQFLPWTGENDPSGEAPAAESDSNGPLMTLASAHSAHMFPHHQADIGKTHVIKTCCPITLQSLCLSEPFALQTSRLGLYVMTTVGTLCM